MKHYLKILPQYFHEVMVGQKTAQLRNNDRHFAIGDTLELQEYDPKRKVYTGHAVTVIVTDLIKECAGLCRGYCILSTFLPFSSTRFDRLLSGKKTSGRSKKFSKR